MVDKIVITHNGIETYLKPDVNPLKPIDAEVQRLRKLKPMGTFAIQELLKQVEMEEADYK